MNYRTLAKGALALSLSLIVGTAAATTSDVQLYGATFESTANGVTNDNAYVADTAIGTYTKTEGGATYGWLAPEGDESKIIAVNGGQALQLNTDAGTLTNKLAPDSVATPLNSAIAGTGTSKGAYIETEAKFVASDTLDAGVRGGTDDTKFAIYAYCDENANPCTTNLVVYHGVMDNNGHISYTNEIFATLIDCEVYTKIRVEMKQLEDPLNPGDIYNVFSVKIGNSSELSSDLTLDALFGGTQDGIWFLTVEDTQDDNNKLLSSITFKGTGEVDNLAVGAIQDVQPAPTVITVAQTIGAHGGSISNGNFQVISGTDVPITITADQGYVIAQIVTNGFPVVDALGQTAVTFNAVFSDAQGANNSIIATFAPANAWFLDPFVRFKASYDASANTFLASLSPDETSFFVGKSPSAGSGAVMFNVPELLDNLDPAYSPLRNVAASEITDGAALRGGAASSELQLGIAGTLTVGSNWVIPFDGSAPYKVTHSIGVALDAMDFGANSAYLYAGAYTSGNRTKVWKLSFANNLANGDALTVEATYDVASAGISRVRAICAETIGGKEYVFVAGGDDSFQGVAVIDTTTGAVTRVLDVSISGQYIQPMSIDIAGIANGTPRMYIGFLGSDSATGSMRVYALAADGISAISTEPVATIPGSVLKVGAREAFAVNVFTLDGETNAVACSAAGVWNSGRVTEAYVLEKKPANLIVRGTFDDGVTVDDRSVAFGAAANETFTAPAGTTITNVTVNGVAQQVAEGTTSFTYEAAALEEYVYIKLMVSEPAAPATVISIALVGGATYTDADGVLTFAAPAGSTITSIYTNGVDTGSTTTFTTNGLTGTVNIVAAATKTRTAPAHKWWENPGVVGTNTYSTLKDDYYGPLHMSASGDYLAVPTWTQANAHLGIYKRDDLEAGEAVPVAEHVQTGYGYSFFGSGISQPLNVALAGSYDNPINISFPLNNANPVLGVDAFIISNSANVALNQFKFTSDNQYVYARCYSPSANRRYIYKFRVLNGLKTTGVNLVDPVLYDFGQQVRSMELAQIGGKDILYALGDDKAIYVMDTSVATPTATKLITDFTALTKYINIWVSGANTGTPHLTVAAVNGAEGSVAKNVTVFTLNAAGTALAGGVEPIVFDTAAVDSWGIFANTASYGAACVVSEDEGTLFLGSEKHVYAIQYVAPASSGYNYPEGEAISDADQLAWIAAKGFTQAQVSALGTNAKFNECYLLNCDITQANAGGSITITGIEVGASGVTVTVSLSRTAGYAGGINGTLKLFGKADLATGDFANTSATVGDAKFASGTSTTATVSGGTAKFFKAVIE